MLSTRTRVGAVAAGLVLIFGLGMFWLVRVATADPDARRAADRTTPNTTPAPDAASDAFSTSGSTPQPSGPPTGADPASGGVTPPTLPTRGGNPPRQRETAPPVPRGAISVGGVTLDNIHPVTMCVAFKNPSGVLAARVTEVALNSSDVTTSVEHCAGDDNITGFPANRECRPGVTLESGGDGCYVGIAARAGRPPADYLSTTTLTLVARCTAATVAPCDAPQLRATPPTPAHPVDVTWRVTGERACVRVAAPSPADGDASPFCPSD
jgi:hypothetical protein